MSYKNEYNDKFSKDIRIAMDKTFKKLTTLESKEFFDNELFDASMHLLNKPGKMLRPLLVFLGASYCDMDLDEVIDIAVSIELLHTSSLIHDDIIDNDNKRRDIDATHVKYGLEVAMLSGDALISKSIQNASRYGKNLIDIMAETAMKMSAGEAMDFRYQRLKKVPEIEECLKIIELKSASLISTATSISGKYKNSNFSKELELFGLNLGIAFQIKDDLEDYLAISDNSQTILDANRPNVVKSIIKSGRNEKDAIKEAMAMNKRYIKVGISYLDKNKFEIFKRYLDMIKID